MYPFSLYILDNTNSRLFKFKRILNSFLSTIAFLQVDVTKQQMFYGREGPTHVVFGFCNMKRRVKVLFSSLDAIIVH